MEDHKCQHEVDLALMSNHIEKILKGQEEMKGILFGNGKEGIRIQLSKIKTKLNVQWALFLGIFGLIAWVLRS